MELPWSGAGAERVNSAQSFSTKGGDTVVDALGAGKLMA